MFWALFEKKHCFTLGILKGFSTEKTVFHGKHVFSRKDKIALQGAGNRPEDPGNNTVFTGFQDIPGLATVCRQAPPFCSVPVKNGIKQSINHCFPAVYSCGLRLPGLGSLIPASVHHVTESTEKQCFPGFRINNEQDGNQGSWQG